MIQTNTFGYFRQIHFAVWDKYKYLWCQRRQSIGANIPVDKDKDKDEDKDEYKAKEDRVLVGRILRLIKHGEGKLNYTPVWSRQIHFAILDKYILQSETNKNTCGGKEDRVLVVYFGW